MAKSTLDERKCPLGQRLIQVQSRSSLKTELMRIRLHLSRLARSGSIHMIAWIPQIWRNTCILRVEIRYFLLGVNQTKRASMISPPGRKSKKSVVNSSVTFCPRKSPASAARKSTKRLMKESRNLSQNGTRKLDPNVRRRPSACGKSLDFRTQSGSR